MADVIQNGTLAAGAGAPIDPTASDPRAKLLALVDVVGSSPQLANSLGMPGMFAGQLAIWGPIIKPKIANMNPAECSRAAAMVGELAAKIADERLSVEDFRAWLPALGS